jgi:hypothetical protein
VRPGKSWIPISLLVGLVALGTSLRLHNITKQNLWIDEYWTLYLATARGEALFQAPLKQILTNPPDVSFSGAPAWWHIWNGIRTTSHPPLYHMVLRFWVDLFGDADGSIRGMSTVFSLVCIVLIYIAVRKSSGDGRQALIASALMSLAPIQIYFSQQVRPYTMLQCISLGAVLVILSIEKRGLTWLKLLALGLAVAGLALTHYFSVAVIGAFAVYALVRFQGKTRWAVVGVIALASGVVALAWASHVSDYSVATYGRYPGRNLLHLALSVPQRLTMESNQDPLALVDNASWPLVIAFAAISYLAPVLMLRKRPDLLIWWLWIASQVGLVLAIDLARHSTLLTVTRYVVLAAPGFYAVMASPLPGRVGRFSPWIILFGVAVYSLDYWQIGPPASQDIVYVSNRLAKVVQPDDVVIVTGKYFNVPDQDAPITYYAIAHYGGPWKRPVLFGTALISADVQKQLLRYRRVWVVGVDPGTDTQFILPGWQFHDVKGSWESLSMWYVTPPSAGHS